VVARGLPVSRPRPAPAVPGAPGPDREHRGQGYGTDALDALVDLAFGELPMYRLQAAANQHPAYLAKYTERIGAMFDTPERFAELFSTAVIITPAKLRI
jgi:hypothetical protein